MQNRTTASCAPRSLVGLLRGGIGLAALACALAAGDQAMALVTSPSVASPPAGGSGGLGAGAASASLATSGYFTRTSTDLTIGQLELGGMNYVRYFLGNGWRDNYIGTLTDNGSGTYTISIGPSSETFSLLSGTYTSMQAVGSTLTYDGSRYYTYTTRDGVAYTFDNTLASSTGIDAKDGRLTKIAAPTGATTTLAYNSVTLTGSVSISRVQSVTNNYGYMLQLQYQSNSATTTSDAPAWQAVQEVTGINLAIDYCSPTADSCSGFTVTWPTVTYTTAPDNSMAQLTTDALSNVTRYTYDSSGRITAIRLPTSSTDNITLSYNGSGQLATLVDVDGTYTYSYSTDGSGNPKITLTDPLAHTSSVTTHATLGVTIATTDGLSHTTTYTPDSYGRITQVTQPEGNYTTYTYDTFSPISRGNVTTTTQVAKSGSGLSNITTSANFSSTCSYVATCNQPNYTVDGNGNYTYYYYNSNGTPSSVVSPTVSGGTPTTSFSYASNYAYYKQSSGAGVTAASAPISQLNGLSSCATASSCSTSAELVISVAYGSTGVANNLAPTSLTQAAGDNSISSAATLTYDSIGNLASMTGPLSDATVFRYDADRRLTGYIGPDPDGAGALHNRAVKVSYNADGLATLVQSGTDAQTDTNWSSFSLLEQYSINYDTLDRKIQESLLDSSSTVLATTQYSHNADGTLECQAVRLNSATFGSLPGACTAATAGSDGPDRISTYYYDSAQRLFQITHGSGTGAFYEASTFNNNGTTATVKDGNGNLTTFTYDGFDRLAKVNFPSTTTGAGTSNSSDYEQYGYDANANMTSIRRRDGTSVTLSYDALNRQTSGLRGQAFGYDNFGRLTSAALAGSTTVSIGYDALSRKTSESGALGTVSYLYDAEGHRTRITWPDSVYVTYAYDLAGELTTVSLSGSTTLATYSYDDLGRRTGLTRGNSTSTSYGYDAANRLTSLSHSLASNSLSQTMAYTASNQLKSVSNTTTAYTPSGLTAGTTNYTPDGLNRIASLGSTSFSYDGRGNLTSDGTRSYGYDIENNLTSASGASLAYDPAGRLLTTAGSATTNFLYDNSQILAEYNTSGAVLRRFVPGAAADEPLVWYEGSGTSTPQWLVPDRLGSIVAVTNASGTPTSINTYDEYGQPGASNAGLFQYTGQAYIPEVGAYYYKSRFYGSAYGRFFQTDSIGYGDGLNWYSYAGNDPLNQFDPSGADRTCVATMTSPATSDYVTNPDGTTNLIITPATYSFDCTGSANPSGGGSGGGGGGGLPKPPPIPEIIISPPPKNCAQEALLKNGGAFFFDSVALGSSVVGTVVPAYGLTAGVVGLGAATGSLINAGAHGDLPGITAGTVGYHVGAVALGYDGYLAAAKTAIGRFGVRSIPIVGIVASIVSVGIDGVETYEDYQKCRSGK